MRPDGKALCLGPDSRSKLPAQAMRPLKMAPNLPVHHSGVPGGCLVWPLLQSLEDSSLNSHPGEEDADSGHSCYCAERSAGSPQSRQPWSQAANSTNPKDSKCAAALISEMREARNREVEFLAQAPQLKSRRRRIQTQAGIPVCVLNPI